MIIVTKERKYWCLKSDIPDKMVSCPKLHICAFKVYRKTSPDISEWTECDPPKEDEDPTTDI